MLPNIIAKLLDPIGWLIMVASLYFFKIFVKKWWVIFLASLVGAILVEILLSKIAGPTHEIGRAFIPLFLAGIIQCSVAFVFSKKNRKNNNNHAYFTFINVEINSGESELNTTPPKSPLEVSEAFEKTVKKFEEEDILIAKTHESKLPSIEKEVIGKKGGLLIFALTSAKPITSMDPYLPYIREHLGSLSAVDDFMENSDKYL